jgi:acetoin utilization deacetylase AcuC-like enzyme
MAIAVVHHKDYTVPLPTSADGAPHRFPMDKFALTMKALRNSCAALEVYAPEPIDPEAILAVHDANYAYAVLSCALDALRTRQIGFEITPHVVRRSRLAAGGTLLAARLALAKGYAANTAGGSHHAHRHFGSGFCVFNDVAIAANQLLTEQPKLKILVIDLDVHQGDGTAMLFADDPRVVTVSVHCEANFPLRKACSDLDIALPMGMTDVAYLGHLHAALPSITAQTAPDLIFYVAGVDVHQEDKLGRLNISDQGLVLRDQLVAQLAQANAVPLVSVMGGGYGADVAAVAARHAQTILTLADALPQRLEATLHSH